MKTAVKALNLYSTGTDANTLQSFNSQSDILTVGAWLLKYRRCLSNNDLALLPALSPKAVYDPAAQKTGIIRNFSVTWGDSVLWGDSVVFGAFVFSRLAVTATDQSVLWGDSVCWVIPAQADLVCSGEIA